MAASKNEKTKAKSSEKKTKVTESPVKETESKKKKETQTNPQKKNVKSKDSVKKVKKEENLEKTTVFVTDEFINEEQKSIPTIPKTEKELKRQAAKEKRKEIFKEIKAFLILLISIGLISFGGYYWYTKLYNKDNTGIKYEKVEKQIAEYKTIKYSLINEKDHLYVLNDKYLIETDDNSFYKIMDLKSEVLYEGNTKFTELYEGIDGNLYGIDTTDLVTENVIDIYRLEDEEFNKVKTLNESGVSFKKILYKDENNNNLLVGFHGLFTGFNEELATISETVIYTLEDNEYKLENYYFVGDEYLQDDEDIVTYDKSYIIFYEIKDNKKNFGLFDIETKKVVIKPQYEGLYTDGINNYIAIKKGLAGIVTSKLKIIVDFQYDFIDRQDNFYVVSKNGKLAIMNEDYKLVTDFIYDYQSSEMNLKYKYTLGEKEYNTFTASYKNNKYILSINNGEDSGLKYDKHETYIIDETGGYQTYTANKFVISKNSTLIYSYNINNKTYTLYDHELDKLYDIDLSEYDFNNYPTIELINENTIIVHINSDIYFNYETGEEIDTLQNYQTLINGVTITYNNKNNKVEYQVNDSVVATLSVNISEDNVYFNKVNDNIIYYNTKKDYVYIEKGE